MAATATASYEASSSLEKVLEHRFLAELTTHLWQSGISEFEVLRGEIDCHGYDLVVEAAGVLRHIQLKAMVRGGKRREVGVNTRLAAKPSGCVIWMIYDPQTLELGPYLWFGAEPGRPLPALGGKLGRHSKGNAQGVKGERLGQRQVGRARFKPIEDISKLAEALFGTRSARRIDGLSKGDIRHRWPRISSASLFSLHRCLFPTAKFPAPAQGILLSRGGNLRVQTRQCPPNGREMRDIPCKFPPTNEFTAETGSPKTACRTTQSPARAGKS